MAVDESVKITITAKDQASSVLKNVGDGAGKLGAALKGLGTVAVASIAAAGAAVGAFAVDSLKAFIDAEKQMTVANQALQNGFDNLTEQQVKNLKTELGTTTVAFTQITDAMQEAGKAAIKLGFDDEDASVAFSKLFQVTGDLKKAQEDLALAEDLAAFSGRSLADAADAITKVHAGATRVVKEFGIQLDDNATSAQALDAVQQKVTGSAESMANTTAGKLTILQTSWTNLQEVVGGALATAITPFIDALSTWAQDPSTQQQFQEIANKVANLATQLGPLVQKLLPALVQGMNLAIGVIQFLGKAFDVTTAVLSDMIFQVMQLIEWVKKIPQEVNNAIASLNTLLSKVPGANGLGFTNAIGDSISNALGIGKRAAGGPVSAGVPYIVGERGEELFVPNQSGTILPSGRGTGGNIWISISGAIFTQDAAEKMSAIIMDQLKMELRM